MAMSSCIRNGVRRFLKESSESVLHKCHRAFPSHAIDACSVFPILQPPSKVVSSHAINANSGVHVNPTSQQSKYSWCFYSPTDPYDGDAPFYLDPTPEIFFSDNLQLMPCNTEEKLNQLREHIITTRRLLLTVYEDYGQDECTIFFPLGYDLAYGKFSYDYQRFAQNVKANGGIGNMMKRDDWLSNFLHFCPLILDIMRMNCFRTYGDMKEDIVLVPKVISEDEMKQQFQVLMEHKVNQSYWNICEMYLATLDTDDEWPSPTFLPCVTEFLGVLRLFQLIIDGINLFDSPQVLKEWVKKKVAEGHISCPLNGGYESSVYADFSQFRQLSHDIVKLKKHFPISRKIRSMLFPPPPLSPCYMEGAT